MVVHCFLAEMLLLLFFLHLAGIKEGSKEGRRTDGLLRLLDQFLISLPLRGSALDLLKKAKKQPTKNKVTASNPTPRKPASKPHRSKVIKKNKQGSKEAAREREGGKEGQRNDQSIPDTSIARTLEQNN